MLLYHEHGMQKFVLVYSFVIGLSISMESELRQFILVSALTCWGQQANNTPFFLGEWLKKGTFFFNVHE